MSPVMPGDATRHLKTALHEQQDGFFFCALQNLASPFSEYFSTGLLQNIYRTGCTEHTEQACYRTERLVGDTTSTWRKAQDNKRCVTVSLCVLRRAFYDEEVVTEACSINCNCKSEFYINNCEIFTWIRINTNKIIIQFAVILKQKYPCPHIPKDLLGMGLATANYWVYRLNHIQSHVQVCYRQIESKS